MPPQATPTHQGIPKCLQVIAACGAAAVAAGLVASYLLRKQNVVVRHVLVFPIKSCRGIEVDRAEVGPYGLEYDREWVILKDDDTREMVTLRNCQRLAQIHVGIDRAAGELVLVRSPIEGSGRTVAVPLQRNNAASSGAAAREVPYKVWGVEGTAVDQGDAVAAWLSEVTNMRVRLYRAAQPRDQNAAKPPAQRRFPEGRSEVLAHDLSSLNIISLQTVEAIRQASGDPEVDYWRFRANIVVDAPAGAWDELEYRQIECPAHDGKPPVSLNFVKYCTRCAVPTVSNEGRLHPRSEPTATLRRQFSARQPYDNTADGKASPVAGINLYHVGTGVIAKGDVLNVTRRAPKPAFTSETPK